MTVYVDDMCARIGRIKMCYTIAISTGELPAMADKSGVARKWIQHADTRRGHFDIAKPTRSLAMNDDPIEVSMSELGRILFGRRVPLIPGRIICVRCQA